MEINVPTRISGRSDECQDPKTTMESITLAKQAVDLCQTRLGNDKDTSGPPLQLLLLVRLRISSC